jgi:hypothetical protein
LTRVKSELESNCGMEPMKGCQVNVNLPCAPFKAFAQGRVTGIIGVRKVPQTTISSGCLHLVVYVRI